MRRWVSSGHTRHFISDVQMAGKKFFTLTFLRRHSVQPSRLLWGMGLSLPIRWLGIANRIYGKCREDGEEK